LNDKRLQEIEAKWAVATLATGAHGDEFPDLSDEVSELIDEVKSLWMVLEDVHDLTLPAMKDAGHHE
jgi:hypothetical protein